MVSCFGSSFDQGHEDGDGGVFRGKTFEQVLQVRLHDGLLLQE